MNKPYFIAYELHVDCNITGSVNEQHLLHVLLSLHITQIMLSYDLSSSNSYAAASMSDDPDADLMEAPSNPAAAVSVPVQETQGMVI